MKLTEHNELIISGEWGGFKFGLNKRHRPPPSNISLRIKLCGAQRRRGRYLHSTISRMLMVN
jgi:hypothetical protein